MSLTYFPRIDDSTLIIVRSDRCSPTALRPQSPKSAPCNPGDAQNELAAIEFGPMKEHHSFRRIR